MIARSRTSRKVLPLHALSTALIWAFVSTSGLMTSFGRVIRCSGSLLSGVRTR
jgi:hypothetical protein